MNRSQLLSPPPLCRQRRALSVFSLMNRSQLHISAGGARCSGAAFSILPDESFSASRVTAAFDLGPNLLSVFSLMNRSQLLCFVERPARVVVAFSILPDESFSASAWKPLSAWLAPTFSILPDESFSASVHIDHRPRFHNAFQYSP